MKDCEHLHPKLGKQILSKRILIEDDFIFILCEGDQMNQCNIQVLLAKSKHAIFIVISGLGFEIQVFAIFVYL